MIYKWCYTCMKYIEVKDQWVLKCACGENVTFNTFSDEDVSTYTRLYNSYDRFVVR